MNKIIYKNIVIVGDEFGIPLLLEKVPIELIKCVIVSGIRKKSHSIIFKLCKRFNIDFLVQPKYNSSDYAKFLQNFNSYKFDLLICNSYSLILREDLLEKINYNAINIHSSLLPKNRGPNPIQWAIINGDEKTGVTIHFIDDGIDTGDIIFQKEVKIDFDDTWVSLSQKISKKTIEIVYEFIPIILTEKKLKRSQQLHKKTEGNKRLKQDSPYINFDKMDDLKIYNMIRAQVAPLKGAFVNYKNKKIYFDKFIDYEQIKFLRKNYSN